jgi:glyoxylase-like metal-dependent hydrolase (beta-lactamase superfamily II)
VVVKIGDVRAATAHAGPWFEGRTVGHGVTLIRETHVHPFARCNIWHVRGRDCDLLVDSGTGLVALAPVLPGESGRPLIVVGTHVHFDHVGGHHEYRDRRGHELEADAYRTMPDAMTVAHLFRSLDAPVDALPSAGWRAAEYRLRPAPLSRALAEGDTIDLGDREFRVLHLPGHSPGSIGLYDARNGMLFAGDVVYDGELIDDLEHSNVETYCASMERLARLPVGVVHAGHYESFDQARLRRLVNQYLLGRRRSGCPLE